MIDETLLAFTAGRDMWSTVSANGIPSAKMADGPMGIASGRVDERDVSILTPSGIALAATWDRALAGVVGELVGGEARRKGVDMVLAPNLNLARSPNAGRVFEMFGEDPLLAGTLGVAWSEGLQSRGVGSIAKHLVCNDSETQRDRYNAIVDETTLREIYLLPFEMTAQAGCAGILTAYNRVNGSYCAQSAPILTDVLRNEWRYTGFTVSDWFGTHAGAESLNAGLDLEMPGPARFMGTKLRDAAVDKTITIERVEEAVHRIQSAALTWAGSDAGAEPGDRDAILAQAAAAGFTLLRNDGDLLPIVPGSIRRLAVIGPNALAPCLQGGTFAKIALRPDAILPVEALRTRFGAETIVFAPGCPPSPRLPTMPARPARDLGDGCDVGLTIDYFGGHDFSEEPLGSETRNTNSLTWFHGMHELGAFDRAGGIRASGLVTPTVSGMHRLHIGGTGSVRLIVDGSEVFAAERAIPASDVMGALKSGDSDHVEVMLEAGVSVRVEAELRYAPARAHGLWFGLGVPNDRATLLAEAETIARDADAVLLVVGETADAGVESKDRDTTAIPLDQQKLAARVIAANPRTIVAVNVGHAFDAGFAADAAALMAVWYPGEAFGPALASVLSGDLEPSGRLPVALAASEDQYPALHATPDTDGRLPYAEGIGIGYRGMIMAGVRPAFAFGLGLGYGHFTYVAASATARSDRGVDLVVTVRNEGSRDSAAVVQAYRPDGALAGFAKQVVAAETTSDICFSVDPIALRRWSDNGWVFASGMITLGVGGSSLDLPLSVTVEFD
jgi:beta-glucosidase